MDTKALDKMLKIFKKRSPVVKVGILQKNSRAKGADSNATIGAKHEFGLDGMPQRSFLKMPIVTKFEKSLEKSKALDKEAFNKMIQQGNLVSFMKNIGIIAENTIEDAFATGGFGKWEKWRIPGYKNNTGQILVDTQQLRNSITSEVKE